MLNIKNTLNKHYSNENWIKDIKYLKSKIYLKHPNPFIRLSKKEFDTQFEELINDIDKLSDAEINFRIMECVSKIGDMHTFVSKELGRSFYPLRLMKFGNDIRITSACESLRDILGAKLIKIQDIDVHAVFKKIKKIIPQENDIYVESKGLEYLTCPAIFEIMGLQDIDNMAFVFETLDGEELRKNICPKSKGTTEYVSLIEKFVNLPEPRTAEHIELPYWSTYIDEEKLLYVRYSSCFDGEFAKLWGIPYWEEYPDFDQFIDQLVSSINNYEIRKFVFDIRENIGGNIEFTTKIFEKLNESPKWKELNHKDRFSVLINNRIFSCGVATCEYLRSNSNATFIGEATGGNVVIFQVAPEDNFYLPNSKIKVRCASGKMSLIASKNTKNFQPDIPIQNSFEEYLKGKDHVFNYVLKK